MEELRLRGYTCPEDFAGSVQKALDAAAEEDIRKVVFAGRYEVDQTIFIPSGMELVFRENASLSMMGEGPLFENEAAAAPGKNSWTFEDSRIYLKGEAGSELCGDLSFCNAKYVVLEDIEIRGRVFFEFCREVRMERDRIQGTGEAVVLARGCNNFIMQHLRAEARENAVLLDARMENGPYVIGKDAEIHEIILRDSELDAGAAVRLQSGEGEGIFNIQIDHIAAKGNGVIIGTEEDVPAKRYFNITATDIRAEGTERIILNETKHCYFGE